MRVILVLLLLCENALASTIQFNIVRGKCDGTGLFSSCDDSAKGGICAYAADANRSWCCPPGEPLCGSWGQTCSGSGNLAGTGQLFCQSGNTRWCCNAQYEICIRDTNAINLCRTKFDNPYSNISEASALSLQSAFFATSTTSSKETSSPISQKTTSSATTTLSQTTTLPQTTAEAAITPASSSSLSGGAIAGVVIGAIAGVALIAAGAFFLGRKYMRRSQNSTQITPKYVVEMQDESSKDNAFGRSELHNTSMPYDPYHGLEHSRNELP